MESVLRVAPAAIFAVHLPWHLAADKRTPIWSRFIGSAFHDLQMYVFLFMVFVQVALAAVGKILQVHHNYPSMPTSPPSNQTYPESFHRYIILTYPDPGAAAK